MGKLLVAGLVWGAALPAAAAEIWCMPSETCLGSDCEPTTDTESSIRLHDPEGPVSTLRTHAEDVRMTRTHEGAVVQWQGENVDGATEVLAIRTDGMGYIYRILRDDGPGWTDRGQCEVQ